MLPFLSFRGRQFLEGTFFGGGGGGGGGVCLSIHLFFV